MKKISFYMYALLLAAVLSGCAKDGVDGQDGEDGAQGPPGTANVIYSAWFSTAGGWVGTTETTTPYFGEVAYYSKAVAAITQAIVDNGAVLCYMKGDPLLTGASANAVFQLPYSIGTGFDFSDVYDFAVSSGNIRFLYKSNDPWDVSDLGPISFRYIVIPGGVAGRGVTPTFGGYTLDELKKMSYEQVSSLFQIPANGTNIR